MLKGVKKFLRKMLGAERSSAPAPEPRAEGPFTLRRWESARTTRLNKGHWQYAFGRSINADLADWLENLRTRSAYELANNPTMEGVINTFAIDIAGDNGPTLQVKSSNPAYNRKLESAWREWARKPDIRGRLGLVDFLKLWVRTLWTAGEFVVQKVTDEGAATSVRMRLKGIHPRRLATPAQDMGRYDVVLGVRQNADGKPLEYMILEPTVFGPYELLNSEFRAIPAKDIIHEFLVLEDDQVRGVPWMSSTLDSIGDLRDYDAQVLDAARQAADFSVSLYTEHVDAEYVEVNESTDIERRTMSTCPPGWKPYTVTPPQPAITYQDYRAERLRDMGRAANMPLMMVRLDASRHNYSSARFDAQPYQRGLSSVQSWLARRVLEPLLWDLEAELRFQGLPRRPADVAVTWIWPKPKHVDEQREAEGQDVRLKNRTLPWSQLVIENGGDPDVVAQQLAEDEARFEGLGITPPWTEDKADTAGDAEVEFRRKVWLGFQADGTVADVAANLVMLKDLAAGLGLPVNAEYVDPYLPVQDAQGNAVTGEVLKDSENDIVGGKVESAPAAADGAGGSAQKVDQAAGQKPQAGQPKAPPAGNAAAAAAGVSK